MKNDFYKGKKVFVTGHTGFKGTWLCKLLTCMGADVAGYALTPPTDPSLYELSDIDSSIKSYIGDIRDYEYLFSVFEKEKPEIVFHLAAQPIVRDSYKIPKYTYETNVMGTVNLCECIRNTDCVRSFLNVTTDKVYENRDTDIAFTEDMPLDGFDPYSNSKSCSELVTGSYKKSFLNGMGISVSTARAGNVIGGGDFANDRLIPDCVRAAIKNEDIIIRNPYSIRPFQHVLEPLSVYLTIAEKQYIDRDLQGCYNVGPDECDCRTTGDLATMFCSCWGEDLKWKNICEENAPHEATFLRLNTDKIKSVFGWKPVWNVEKAVEKTVEWTKIYRSGGSIPEIMEKQIEDFFETEG